MSLHTQLYRLTVLLGGPLLVSCTAARIAPSEAPSDGAVDVWAWDAAVDTTTSGQSSDEAAADAPPAEPSPGPNCTAVHPRTESGTCPMLPSSGLLCDLSNTPSGFCGAPDCPAANGCCAFAEQPSQREICFPACAPCPARSAACVPQGVCQTAADCQGALPHICQTCAVDSKGVAAQGCAHWECTAGRCEVAYCPSGLVCTGGQGCPSYYLPALDRTCNGDADCVIVRHQVSCCMSVDTSVRLTEQAHFAEVESQCSAIHDSNFYGCGCVGSVVAEDGTFPGAGQDIVASCVGGICRAIVHSGPFTCGSGTCAAGESCCVSPGDGGCAFSCMASCPVFYDDAGNEVYFACSTR
jgi:hypothetical protein